MGMKCKTLAVLTITGRALNDAISFVVFSFLDLFDVFLCVMYKALDFIIEAEWKPCYCTSAKEAITSSGKILVSEKGESRIVCLSNSKLHLEEISDTLYTRPFLVSEYSNFTVNELRRLKMERKIEHSCEKIKKGSVRSTTTFTVNSTIIEMLQGKIGKQPSHLAPRWSDCDCTTCNSWTSSNKRTLYVRAEGPKGHKAKEDVLFIHGFISSSAFWTETLFPNFSDSAKSSYRFFAIDLLGFGRSPKPSDSLYTTREHLDMIEGSVLEPYKVKSFHIVAHSLGCILALALAVRHPGSVKSLTLLAPPYFPVPKGEHGAQYVMRKVAPRRVWPPIVFGASIACWYEHISRTVCLLIAKNHRLWEFLTKLITRNRGSTLKYVADETLSRRRLAWEILMLHLSFNISPFIYTVAPLFLVRIRTYLIEGFFCHTHNAAWHTLHNIICGTSSKLDLYLDTVRDKLNCAVNVIHGLNDELIPVECSFDLQKKIPRATVKVIEKEDHITIVIRRQKAFARELEEMWRNASG